MGPASLQGLESLLPGGSGSVRRTQSAAGPGRGLLGLRERLGLYGGEITAGPQPGGGWQVRAVLPLAEAA